MQNAKSNDAKTYELKIEKTIAKPPAEVFRAISQGRLFQGCGAESESLKIDFKVGGKYEIQFKAYGMTNVGEFLEIVPDKKIVFTWCQDYATSPKPDTVVRVELKDLGGKTQISLAHSGFEDKENMEAHEGGWNNGLRDMSAEMVEGRLSFMRLMKAPLGKVYDACKNPQTFFGLMGDVSKGKVDFKVGGSFKVPTEKGELNGDFLEIVPNEKIVFSWKSSGCGAKLTHDTKVTLTFETDDDDAGASWLGLVHEGLDQESQQISHHEGWDYLLARIAK